jgi:putative transposase
LATINFVSFYRRHLPHYQRDYKSHFVTKDRHTLPGWARDVVLNAFLFEHDRRFNLRVVVVMPDHAHLILTPLLDSGGQRISRLPEIMSAIKSHSARLINNQLRQTVPIWQEESFDHVLRCSESPDAKVAYILANPVRAGLARVAEEYPWSWRKPPS